MCSYMAFAPVYFSAFYESIFDILTFGTCCQLFYSAILICVIRHACDSLSIRICKHQVSELTIIVFTGICFMPQLNQRRRPLFRLSSENLLALIYISFTATALLHPFNGLFSRTTLVSRYQKVKTSLDLNEARDYGFWGYIGISWTVCKQSAHCSVQTDNTPMPYQS